MGCCDEDENEILILGKGRMTKENPLFELQVVVGWMDKWIDGLMV